MPALEVVSLHNDFPISLNDQIISLLIIAKISIYDPSSAEKSIQRAIAVEAYHSQISIDTAIVEHGSRQNDLAIWLEGKGTVTVIKIK